MIIIKKPIISSLVRVFLYNIILISLLYSLDIVYIDSVISVNKSIISISFGSVIVNIVSYILLFEFVVKENLKLFTSIYYFRAWIIYYLIHFFNYKEIIFLDLIHLSYLIICFLFLDWLVSLWISQNQISEMNQIINKKKKKNPIVKLDIWKSLD